jgi:hypothetical protein
MATRTESVVPQFVLLALVLLPCSTALSASKGASGRFSPHCDGASFYLSNVDGLPPNQRLILNMRHYALPWWVYRPQEVWEDVYAEICGSRGKCESAKHARIWLDKANPSDRRVSGKYEVDFSSQNLAGQFLTKYRADKHYICE